MKAEKVIERVRHSLQDTKKPYRWDDPELLIYLSDGQRLVASRRPDALYVSAITVTEPAEIAAVTSELSVTDRFVAALSAYCCHRALQKDAEHAANAKLADDHLKRFEELLAAA